MKFLVITIWLLDCSHTACICAATWDYLILNFGNGVITDVIPITIALTVAFTATTTFTTHLFFSHRVFRLSRKNYYITTPLVVLAFVRLGAALVSTIEMRRLKSFHAFVQDYSYVFTLGLSSATTLDVLITTAMWYFLQMSRTGFREMDHIVDTIMLYTLNSGALTYMTTVMSLIFWLAMPGNLVFLGLHFSISKLYANSLLGTLNSRRTLRRLREKHDGNGDTVLPVLFPTAFGPVRGHQFQPNIPSQGEGDVEPVSKLEISVEKMIEYDVNDESLGAHPR